MLLKYNDRILNVYHTHWTASQATFYTIYVTSVGVRVFHMLDQNINRNAKYIVPAVCSSTLDIFTGVFSTTLALVARDIISQTIVAQSTNKGVSLLLVTIMFFVICGVVEFVKQFILQRLSTYWTHCDHAHKESGFNTINTVLVGSVKPLHDHPD
jgi:ABC-type multidrug transport system fused ATPase/permease subunit